MLIAILGREDIRFTDIVITCGYSASMGMYILMIFIFVS